MILWQYFGTLNFFWTPLSQWHHFMCSSPLLPFIITIFDHCCHLWLPYSSNGRLLLLHFYMVIWRNKFIFNNYKVASHQVMNLKYVTCSSHFMGSSKPFMCGMATSMLIFWTLDIFDVPLTQIFILNALTYFLLSLGYMLTTVLYCFEWFTILEGF